MGDALWRHTARSLWTYCSIAPGLLADCAMLEDDALQASLEVLQASLLSARHPVREVRLSRNTVSDGR